MNRLLLIVLLSIPSLLWSQKEFNISGDLSANAIFSSGDLAPFWLYSRQEGRWGIEKGSQFLSTAALSAKYATDDNFSINLNLEADYNSQIYDFYLHSYNLDLNWHFLNLRAGRHSFDPIFEKGYEGQGSYLYGDNARPLDRITIGIPSFTSLPGFLKRFEIKGELSHGLLDDKHQGAFKYHKDVLLHEKYGYLRWNGGRWKPYLGLNHSVLMGGYRYNGEKIPIDYWKAILGKSSEKIGGGDATNAAGGHMGLYDVGLYYFNDKGSFRFYYQLPFADASGMRPFVRNRDQIAGIMWEGKKNGILNSFTFEWINSSYQSGNGMPDARFELEDGSIVMVVAFELDDPAYREDLMRKIGVDNPGSYSKKDVSKYLRDNYNRGNRYGGRDWYMSNGTYPAGWTHYGMLMGSPFNLTYAQLAHKNPNLGIYSDGYQIVNDRFKAIHIGASGAISQNVFWDAKFSFSRNYGSYHHLYPGRYTWDETKDYFFKEGENQLYSRIGLSWLALAEQKLEVNAVFGMDIGELSQSVGMQIGVSKHF